MKVRNKILILITAALILFTGISHVMSQVVLSPSYDQMEKDSGNKQIAQLENALQTEQSEISTAIIDYTNWDDSHYYIENNNSDFIETSFVSATFANLGLYAVMIVQNNGSVLFAKVYDDERDEILDAPQEIIGTVKDGGVIFEQMMISDSAEGYLEISGRILNYASRMAYDSNATGTPQGFFCFMRMMNEKFANDIKELTTYSVTLIPYDEGSLQRMLGDEHLAALQQTDNYQLEIDESNMELIILVRDPSGSPIGVMTSPMERDINIQKTNTLNLYNQYFAVMSIVIFALIILVVEQTVLSRILKLNNDVNDLGKRPEGDKKLKVDGKDEITALTKSINKMLDNLEAAQEKVISSEKRFRAIVQDQTEMIYRFDRHSDLTFSNAAFNSYYGTNPSIKSTHNIENKIFNEDLVKFRSVMANIVGTDQSVCTELRCIDSDGAIKWQQWTIRPIVEEGNNITEYQVVAHDITEERRAQEELKRYRENLEEMVKDRTAELMFVNEVLEKEAEMRRRAEDDLKESQRQYMAVVEDQTELIVRMTGDGTIKFANTAFIRYFSMEGKRVIDKTFMQNIIDDDIGNFTMFLNGLTRDHPAGMIQYRVHIGEDTRWQQWTYRLIFDSNGTLSEIQGVGRDITEQKRIEQEMIRSERLESLGMLAGGMAHEFNNILTKVLGNITLTKSLLKESDPLFVKMDKTERAIYEAKKLTDSILTFSNGGEPIKEALNVNDVLTDAANAASLGSSVKIDIQTAPDVPGIYADRSQISQMFKAIISNAVESMPNGGTVKVSASNKKVDSMTNGCELVPGNYVEIGIVDHGVGIPRDGLSHIFDPYYTTKGTAGLGLTTALSIVKRHGGNIQVESTVDVGSKFTIFLPAADGMKVVEKEKPLIETKVNARILLMDDEEGILEVGSELLREFGFEVECARTGEDTLALYKKFMKKGKPFDLVIMDLTIKGGMGGKDAVKKLLELDPAAKAIVSSGYSNDPVMAHFDDYGFKGVVKKPYMIGDMVRVIQSIIEATNSVGKKQ